MSPRPIVWAATLITFIVAPSAKWLERNLICHKMSFWDGAPEEIYGQGLANPLSKTSIDLMLVGLLNVHTKGHSVMDY